MPSFIQHAAAAAVPAVHSLVVWLWRVAKKVKKAV